MKKNNYYKKKLLMIYFFELKYARKFRERHEEKLLNDFEKNCFYKEEWNYLI
jgi:hypothetical protein